MLGVVGPDLAAVGGDQLDREQVVAGQAVLAFEPARAAAEGQSGDARRRDPATRGGQPVRLGGRVELAPGAAAADPGPPGRSVDLDILHRAYVDDQAVVVGGLAGDRVTARADGHRQPFLAAARRGPPDVTRISTGRDQPRPLVDHRVEQRPSRVVLGVRGPIHCMAVPPPLTPCGPPWPRRFPERHAVHTADRLPADVRSAPRCGPTSAGVAEAGDGEHQPLQGVRRVVGGALDVGVGLGDRLDGAGQPVGGPGPGLVAQGAELPRRHPDLAGQVTLAHAAGRET